MGNFVAQAVLISWLPMVLAMFLAMPARRAVVWSILIGWLFLPMSGFSFPALPDYTKMSATCFGILLGAALFDPNTLLRLKPRLADLPFVVFCLVPMTSSVINGLGAYDGLSATLDQVVTWGLPYLIGRAYFSSVEGLKELSRGLVIGGLIYVAFCLYEVRMSPQLHLKLYGFMQHEFYQSARSGGWRPMVFMQHGLMVGMWMCMSALMALWMWRSGSLKGVWSIPMGWIAAAITVTAVLCKSFGALVLLGLGCVMLLVRQKWVAVPLMVFLTLLPAGYYAVRYPRVFTADTLMSLAGPMLSEERAGSLNTRLQNEDILSARASQQPLFGWGGWGRNRVLNEEGRDITITDGLWIIIVGVNGLVGLAAFTMAFSYPGWVLIRRIDYETWSLDWVPYYVGLTTVVLLYQVDCILNAMVNPVFTLVLGSLVGVAGLIPRANGRKVVRS
ncbi:MAG: hypothetical protein RLN76_03440 [Phycisphaeraceae bacterium]